MKKKKHSIDIIFMFVLFTVFAILSMVIVYLGSGVFSKITENSKINSEQRTGLSYIVNKLRIAETGDDVSIEEKDGYQYLIIDSKSKETEISTIIFFRNNKLVEINILKGDDFTPDYGDYIMDVKDFQFDIDENENLLNLEITDTHGNMTSTCVYLDKLR